MKYHKRIGLGRLSTTLRQIDSSSRDNIPLHTGRVKSSLGFSKDYSKEISLNTDDNHFKGAHNIIFSLLGLELDFLRVIIRYYNDTEREKFKVDLINNTIQKHGTPHQTNRFKPNAFIMYKENLFIMPKHNKYLKILGFKSPRQHSSISRGEAVEMAGTIMTNLLGKITYISNDSGHYQPSREQFKAFLLKKEILGIVNSNN